MTEKPLKDISERFRRLEQQYERGPTDPGTEIENLLEVILNEAIHASISLSTEHTIEKIYNGGFEIGNLSGWTLGGSPLPSKSSTHVHSGAWSVLIPSSSSTTCSQTFPAVPKSNIDTFGCYAYKTLSESIIAIWIYYSDGSGTEYQPYITGGTWNFLNLKNVVPSGKNVIRIEFKNNAAYLQYWIDDVSLITFT